MHCQLWKLVLLDVGFAEGAPRVGRWKVTLGSSPVNGTERPYDQTSRRFAECTVPDVSLENLVLEVFVLEVVVLLGQVSAPK